MAQSRMRTWPWWKILLWAYSILYVFFWIAVMVGMVFFPSASSSSPDADPTAVVIMGIMFVPVLIFLISVGAEKAD